MLKNKNILVLAPHTDDGELGCGGTIARAIREGAKVTYVAFSICEDSVPEGFPSNQLEIEVKNATSVLGILPENLHIFNFKVRTFNHVRQEILELLIKLRKEINPDLVFLPNRNDVHQDHTIITNEGIRAFKNVSILGYELIWNNLSFDSDCIIHLQKEDIDTKINSLKKYLTQENRSYFNPEFIKSLAQVRGVQVKTQYAEAFEVIRLTVK